MINYGVEGHLWQLAGSHGLLNVLDAVDDLNYTLVQSNSLDNATLDCKVHSRRSAKDASRLPWCTLQAV